MSQQTQRPFQTFPYAGGQAAIGPRAPAARQATDAAGGGGFYRMDCQALWAKATALLREDMPEVSYKTWIASPLTPFALTGDTLYVEVATEFVRRTILSRYQELILNAVSEQCHKRLSIEYLTPQEREARFGEGNGQPEDAAEERVSNPKYTFDTFVVGSSNRFAHAAALAVAEAPGEAYNPLFIYGGVGLGKTHLMHAVGHYVEQQSRGQRMLYITSENFTNELIAAIQNHRNTEFRNRFRNLDVLMIDDIQFLGNRERTQEEFFHTFNALHAAGKQIIITSDKPPKEIASLEERLYSRFEWGLIADIQRPDIETRIAILRQKALSEAIWVNDDVLEIIARNIESNIRELEGSLTRVVAFAALEGLPLTAELAEKLILDGREIPRITYEAIQKVVATYYNVDIAELTGKKRTRNITLPRQVAVYLTRELTELSLPAIGDAFGGRDHTTIMHSCEKIADLARDNKSRMAHELEDLRKTLTTGN